LILIGIKMWRSQGQTIDPDNHPVMKSCRRWMRVTPDYGGDKFFVRRNGLLCGTPLLAALILAEVSDLLFTLDSIPAVLAFSSDPFLIYTSNAFAILGLRSLYVVLSGALNQLAYLNHGLSIILGFVGFKMLVSHLIKIPATTSLGVTCTILAISIICSVWHCRNSRATLKLSHSHRSTPI